MPTKDNRPAPYPVPDHGASTAGSPVWSRRSVLTRGVKLAFVAPAVLAALRVAEATADDDDRGSNRGRGRDHDDDTARHQRDDDTPRQGQGLGNRPFTADLCRAAGGDPLTSGDLSVRNNGQLVVRLRDAVPSATYQVQFVRFQDGFRESLGAVTTGAAGHFTGTNGVTFTGGGRAGTFVISRNGVDQFMTCVNP